MSFSRRCRKQRCSASSPGRGRRPAVAAVDLLPPRSSALPVRAIVRRRCRSRLDGFDGAVRCALVRSAAPGVCRSVATSPRRGCRSWCAPLHACSVVGASLTRRDRVRSTCRGNRGGAEAAARRRAPAAARGSSLRARRSIERPLPVLLDEVRSSIDYYRNQSDSSPLADRRTGGAARLPGSPTACRRWSACPSRARPRAVALGDISSPTKSCPARPPLPAQSGSRSAVPASEPSSTCPRNSARLVSRSVQIPQGAAAGAVVVVRLGGLTFDGTACRAQGRNKRTQAQSPAPPRRSWPA
jgi:hypothetical protein